MTALAQPSALAVRATPCPLGIEIVETLERIAAEWRILEAEGAASPYQRLDWVRAYAEAMVGKGRKTRVILLRDPSGRPVMVLPLLIRRIRGLDVATSIGDRHANFHLPLTGRIAPDPASVAASLQEAGHRLRVDLFHFVNLPREWEGCSNPLAQHGKPSPSNAYGLALDPDPEVTFLRAYSKDARKHLRQKERYLGQIAAVSELRASTEAEVDEILQAFYAMRRERFRQLGIANEFDAPEIQAFMRAAALAGLDRGEPALELWALKAGDRIVAVFGAAVDRRQASGMIIAFDGDPSFARCSPGELLLARVIRGQCQAGRTFFDLGVGEARYKNSICDTTIALMDAVIPVSHKGRAAAEIGNLAIALKRRVKQTPRAWQAVARLRAMKVRMRL